MDRWDRKSVSWRWIFSSIVLSSQLFMNGIDGSEISDQFYGECGTPYKLCSGIGPTSNCIATRTCTYAGAISENATTYVLLFYANESEKYAAASWPCIVGLTVLNDVDETTEWITGQGYNTKHQCKDELKLENFWPVLYVNTTTSCKNSTTSSWGESLITSTISKSKWRTSCEDRLGNMSSNYIQHFSANGKIVTAIGAMSTAPACLGKNSGLDWPKSWSEALKDVKPLEDSLFYTNIKSFEELHCLSSSASQIGTAFCFLSSVILIIISEFYVIK